jgi:hypothetical protein
MFQRNLLISSVLKLEAVGSSKISVNTANITPHINPKDQHLNLHCCVNLKFYMCTPMTEAVCYFKIQVNTSSIVYKHVRSTSKPSLLCKPQILYVYPEDGGSRFFQNIGKYPQYYMAYNPTRSTSKYSLLCKPQI